MADADDAPGAGAAASGKRARLSEEERRRYNERKRQWRLANKDKVRDSLKKWRAANSEKMRAAYRAKMAAETPEERGKRLTAARARTAAWAAANPEKKKAANRKHREENPDKYQTYSREWVSRNRESHALSGKRWREVNPQKVRAAANARHAKNPDVARERWRRWAERHPQYKRERWASDDEFRLANLLRSRLWAALRAQKASKAVATFDLIGCSIEELKAHLQSQFQPGMTWHNYGEWHIDHIRPCASFVLADPLQQKRCFHFTNLQPLWADDNRRKNARLDWRPESA